MGKLKKFARWWSETPGQEYRRVSAGTPKGGQFTAGYHCEVPMNLTASQQAFNAEGSWGHPAMPQTAAQALDFWLSVPVPPFVTEHIMARQEYVGSLRQPAIARMLARCSALRSALLVLPDDEARRLAHAPLEFPDGRIFTARDGLAWYECLAADRGNSLLPRLD